MRISLFVVSALAAISVISSSTVSAAPMRVGSFGGGHFGHFRSFGFHPGFDHRLAGAHFRGGHGRFFGGGLGLFAGPYGDAFGSDYGSPSVISSNFSGVRVEVAGGGGAPAADSESHGDCLFHKLIYNADGHYIGQKTSRACY